MNLLGKKFLGTSLALGLAALNLSAQNASQLGNLPLWFEAGQAATFTAHASGTEFAISSAGAEFSLTKKNGETAGCHLQFVGANPAARIAGDRQLAGKINYFLGSNPGQWRSGVPTFAQVRVENVYPGVNVVYYGNRQQLEYDFDLAAGVNPSVIALRFDGAEKISVNPHGELVIRFAAGEVIQHAPVAYQTVHGTRQEIAAGYKILDAHTAAFALGHYNAGEPMVIDPVLSYSSYFGGNYDDTGWAIAVNPADGSIYVAGQTFSTKFTNGATNETSGAFQPSYHGGKLTGDGFVARFDVDSTGTNLHLLYATYLGGSGNDGALGLAVDTNGNAYVTGFTDSSDFPTTNALYGYGHIRSTFNPNTKTYPVDAFVTELNTNGSKLVYSTYLGGESMDAAYGIAVDEVGNAYVTGYTYSTNFPVTRNAFQPHLKCPNTFYFNANAFVAKIAAGGTNLNYSTYLGGTNFDEGRAIAYNNGMVFVAGSTSSTNFPNTNALAGFKQLNNGSTVVSLTRPPDAFVTAFTNSSITNLTLLYSTFLGGSNTDVATSIAAGRDGTAYVAGYTSSINFPNTATNVPGLPVPYLIQTVGLKHTNTVFLHTTNGFLTQITWNGTNATKGYSAVFGGNGKNVANGVALDTNGNAYVVGSTTSRNFPVTTNNISGFLTAKNHSWPDTNNSDVFIIAFGPTGTNLLYSACLGGRGNDFGNGIAIRSYTTTNTTATNNVWNACIVGQTFSANFPVTTNNALQFHRNGTNDMFIAIISTISTNVISPAVVTRTIPELVIAPENLSASSVQGKVAGAPPSPASGISLKWQSSLTDSNYDVEYSTDLAAGSWHIVSPSPAYSNGWYRVTLPTTNGVQFFRLRQH